MSACYVCAIHNDPSVRPDPIGQCRCGIFTCMYDGARRHKIGEFECALCIVEVLLASAGVRLPGPDDGGGGGAAMMAAEVRRFLGTEDFEAQCEELQLATSTHRAQWRQWIEAGTTLGTMEKLGAKLGEFTGKGDALANALVEAYSESGVRRGLLADAVGVAQHSARREGTPEQLLELSMALPEVEQRVESRGQAVGAVQPATQVKKEEKLKTMTVGKKP